MRSTPKARTAAKWYTPLSRRQLSIIGKPNVKYDIQKIEGTLTADISNASPLIPIDIDTFALLQTEVNFPGGEWTYLVLFDEVNSEEVKVIDTTGNFLVVERGTSGSTPQAFSATNTTITNSFGPAAIADIVAGSPITSSLTVGGSGLAEVTQIANIATVHVDLPNFIGENGIAVVGTYPNISFALELDAAGCCPGEGTPGGGEAGAVTLAISSQILQGSVLANVISLSLQKPVFTGAGGVTITGDWPAYTITGPGIGGGGSGTVTSVAVGAGLSLTGSPTINPTISITNTGVLPGTYGGVIINARGQLEGVPAAWNPISNIVFVGGGALVSRVGDTANITLAQADVGSPGVVELADSGAPLNAADDSSAVTPALLAAALGGTGNAVAGASTGEGDGLYTNIVSSTAVSVNLAAGQKIIFIGEVSVTDNAAPLTPVAYGVGVFDAAGVKRYGSKIITQSKQAIVGFMSGPYVGTIAITTTAIPSGSTLQGATLAIFKA